MSRKTSGFSGSDTEETGLTASTSDSDDDGGFYDDQTMAAVKDKANCCRPCFTAACFCHFCYVLQLMIYMVVFPLWTKWLLVNPMPQKFWNAGYDPWPMVDTPIGRDLALEVKDPILMSSIPDSPASCNYSCLKDENHGAASMNFETFLTLNDSLLAANKVHTAYPVLLASSDFRDWWVVADRRHSFPAPFWRARTAGNGLGYQYVSPSSCTRPPASSLAASEEFTGTYILGCVVWSPADFAKLEAATEITDLQVATMCSSVGGVCGWGCGSNIPPERLPGCTADGTIDVTPTSIAGFQVPATAKTSFKGTVKMQECLASSPTGECMTSDQAYSHWTCHKCQYDPTPIDAMRRLTGGIPGIGGIEGIGDMPAGLADPDAGSASIGLPGVSEESGKGGVQIYTSLPRVKVHVSGAELPQGTRIFTQPRFFLLSSSVKTKGLWHKLYMNPSNQVRPPVPLDAQGKPIISKKKKAAEEDAEKVAVQDPVLRQAMTTSADSRVDIRPDWCFGSQGPLYLVACAVNGSIYSKNFQDFKAGQTVAPPPFNDRCVAVSGRCGYACQARQYPMANCSADGHILQEALVSKILPRTNNLFEVRVFVYLLLLGFSVRVLLLCPGVFSSYSHDRKYKTHMTSDLGYVAVNVLTTSESKHTVLRSLIGGVSCMPNDARCHYHVVVVDEGHRAELKLVWEKLNRVIESIPNVAGHRFEENVRKFFRVWVEETKNLTLKDLKDGFPGSVDDKVLQKISGRKAYDRILEENGWKNIFGQGLQRLDAAIAELQQELGMEQTPDDISEKYLQIWPRGSEDIGRDDVAERKFGTLRLHYLARAKPKEDERTLKTAHVAPGTWYYKVTESTPNHHWLDHRGKAFEMVYGIEEEEAGKYAVPVQSCRGKVGGINFAVNYLHVEAHKRDNLYPDKRDTSKRLFSICDANHQYQPDFFHTTIPYFFDHDSLLEDISFTQCPKHYATVKDQSDYLDSNNAQFFRLTSIIRNNCGGVSASATNSTWLLTRKAENSVWDVAVRRVRDKTTKHRSEEYVEYRTFQENVTIQGFGRLSKVLTGSRSQFINRRLSFGMARDPLQHLAEVQRSIEGDVVLSMQTFLGGFKNGVGMLWCTVGAFIAFVISLISLVTKKSPEWRIVQWGWIPKDWSDRAMAPLKDWLQTRSVVFDNQYFQQDPELLQDYMNMTLQFITWVVSLVLVFVIVTLVTNYMKCLHRLCGYQGSWPSEMRWWGRLMILMDLLTYFFWFWSCFFWIGFNYYNIFADRTYHFSPVGMFIFMLVIQVLSWGMIIAVTMRQQLLASMEANEVVGLTLDNMWRSTQLFYMTAPLLAYSIIKGVQDYTRYRFYGQDISHWVGTAASPGSGDERSEMTIALVKYWTLLLEIGAIAAWIYFAAVSSHQQGSLASCIIITLVALDVLHPCAYLWVGTTKMTAEKAKLLSWYAALTSKGWWAYSIQSFILNATLSGCFKYLGPLSMLALPLLTLIMPYVGVNQAFMMVATISNR